MSFEETKEDQGESVNTFLISSRQRVHHYAKQLVLVSLLPQKPYDAGKVEHSNLISVADLRMIGSSISRIVQKFETSLKENPLYQRYT